MTSHSIRFMLGHLTQAEFATKYKIPLATVKNWDARDCMPEYIENLIFQSIEDEANRIFKEYIVLVKEEKEVN